MKRLVTYISLGLLLVSPNLMAQHSLPSSNIRTVHLLSKRNIGEERIGLRHLLKQPNLQLQEGQIKYLKALYSLHNQGALSDESNFYSGIEAERIKLLKAINYYQQGRENYTTSLALLNALNTTPLYNYEIQQARLLKAYLLLFREKKEAYKEVATLLTLVMESKDILGDQATLYKSSLLWQEGKTKQAHKLLESRMWSNEIMPEVEYQGALLSYAIEPASTALATTQKLLRKYPEFKNRPRLMSMMGRAYYELEDFPNVLTSLSNISHQDLLPSENYLLGATLYQLNRYNEALLPLQKASLGNNETKGVALFALGNVYQHLGENHRAELAFESTLKHTSNAKLREETLYRLLELGHSLGYDPFGARLTVVQTFLKDYPNSSYRPRIMSIMRAYISRSKTADGLALIEQMSSLGLQLNDLKQQLLYKQALQSQKQESQYLDLLNQSISLGKVSSSYTSALIARSEYALNQKQYEQARKDAELATLHQTQNTNTDKLSQYLWGYSLFNLKQYENSIKHFESFAQHTANKALQQDALLRIGDSYLAQNDLQAALSNYQKAQQLENGNEEALYRISSIYTRLGQYEQQSKQVALLKEHFPNSNYLPQMLYDKGRSERIKGLNKESLDSFEEIIERYPLSTIAPAAILEQALIYSNLNQDEQAILSYKKLITTYPESKEAIVALSDLKSIYSDSNQLDEYLSYAQTLGGQLKLKQDDEAHIKFLSLERKAQRDIDITNELVSYLQTYPNSPDRLKVERLLATSYRSKGQTEQSIQVLKQALNQGLQAESKVQIFLDLAELYLATQQPEQAYRNYREAYQISVGNQTYHLKAALGVLTSGLTLERHNEDILLADQLLAKNKLSTQEREQVQLLKGKHQEANKSFKTAITTYSAMEKAYNSPYGAEAIVRRADIQLRLKLTQDGLKGLESFIDSGTSQDYWLARAFILLSDLHGQQGDHYLAQQYLESLKENYHGTESDIQEMINNRLPKYSN